MVSPVGSLETIDTKVPELNFFNESAWSSGPDDNSLPPDERISKLAYSVATSGKPVPMVPPFQNSTYHLGFDGPAMRCKPANSSVVRLITEELGTSGATSGGSHTSYASWAGRYPTDSDGLSSSFSVYDRTHDSSSPDAARLFVMTNIGNWDRYLESDEPQVLWRRIVNVTECMLFNASYSVDFKFHDGIQTQEVNITQWKTPVALTTGSLRLSSPFSAPHGGVMLAVGRLLVGSATRSYRGNMNEYDSSVARKFMNIDWDDADSVPQALERLFQNVTLSILSDDHYLSV